MPQRKTEPPRELGCETQPWGRLLYSLPMGSGVGPGTGAGGRAAAQGTLPGLRLLHFDGLTELHYLLKILRRAQGVVPGAPSRHGAARLMQIAAVAGRAGDAQRLHRIWRLAKTLDRPQAAALEARGVLSHDAPGIAQSVAAQLGFCPDLSPAAFDRALIVRERDLLESLRATFGFDPESLA